MAHPLCDRTVTLYGMEQGRIIRIVAENCYYAWEDAWEQTQDGPRFQRNFLLILPKACPLRPGWRILEGVGPKNVDWASFLPVTVPGLSEAAYVKPWYLAGRLHHIEAGRK